MLKNAPFLRLAFPLILPVLLVAWLTQASGPTAAAPGEGAGQDRQSGQAGIPPLDLTVPAKIETATFALG